MTFDEIHHRRSRRPLSQRWGILMSVLARFTLPAFASKSDTASAPDDNAIRPFHLNIPQSALDDLRQRVLATQWPEKETVTDSSQGVPLATMQELARYWATDYDWHKVESKLNALPQFVTKIDGLDIHF